jgi:hypothetical protein
MGVLKYILHIKGWGLLYPLMFIRNIRLVIMWKLFLRVKSKLKLKRESIEKAI